MTIERPMFPPRAESVDSFSHQPGIGKPESTNLTGESGKASKALSRRLMLGGLAILPAALPAAVGKPATDPIYAAIKRHKEAAVVWDAAVHVWAGFSDGPAPMPIERRIERERIDDAQEAARDALENAGVDLVNTSPTTLGGIVLALNYIREQMLQDDGIYMPSGLRLSDDTDSEYPVAWIDAFLDTIEHAATELDEAGKAVRS
jgi:hypothetical protein